MSLFMIVFSFEKGLWLLCFENFTKLFDSHQDCGRRIYISRPLSPFKWSCDCFWWLLLSIRGFKLFVHCTMLFLINNFNLFWNRLFIEMMASTQCSGQMHFSRQFTLHHFKDSSGPDTCPRPLLHHHDSHCLLTNRSFRSHSDYIN